MSPAGMVEDTVIKINRWVHVDMETGWAVHIVLTQVALPAGGAATRNRASDTPDVCGVVNMKPTGCIAWGDWLVPEDGGSKEGQVNFTTIGSENWPDGTRHAHMQQNSLRLDADELVCLLVYERDL